MKLATFIAGLGVLTLAASAHAETARPAITGVSHIAVYSADAAKTEAFYTYQLGANKGADPENPAGTRYYFSASQFVEVLPLPANAGVGRVDHIAFATVDAERLRQYLGVHKIAVPARVSKGGDGSLWFDVADPEGNRVEFVQAGKTPVVVTSNPLSPHIIHVGYIIHNRAREDAFFRDVLGFKPYWYGGFKEDVPTWVSQQVPDGRDWLEYMIAGTPDGKGIPADMTQQTAGVLNHFSLGVSNIEAAYTSLWTGGKLDGQAPDALPKIGRDAKWQLNLIDPDGTRAEVMEFHAIGTPCCSSFTAADPDK